MNRVSNLKEWGIQVAPWFFIFLWSMGYIAGKYTLHVSGPFHLLFLRGALSSVVFLALALLARVKFPSFRGAMQQLLIGLLLHGFFLGGNFYAMAHGMPSAVAALICGLQPVLTAMFVVFAYKRSFSRLNWLGIFLGLAGVFLVLSPGGSSFDVGAGAGVAVVLALLGITSGVLLQKSLPTDGHVFANTFYQYLAMSVLMFAVSQMVDEPPTQWGATLAIGLVGLVVGVSVTAVLLLLFMIRSGESEKVATYFYLVPVATTVEAWLLFGESITPSMVAGMLVTVAGLLLVIRKRAVA